MNLTYERGDVGAPKGHALLYFVAQDEPVKLYVTYIIVLPIAIDLTKYMPPFLAPHMQGMSAQELSSFAFPPVPEEVQSRQWLDSLASSRDDDLLFGGSVDPSQTTNLLSAVNDIVQSYAQEYGNSMETRVSTPEEQAPERLSEVGVNEVLYQLMGARERLAELARLISHLRFAAEGANTPEVEQVETEVRLLSQHLPENYQTERLVQTAKTTTTSGGEMARLYLDRCYKLADEDYLSVQEIEGRIRSLELDAAREQN